MLRISLKTIPHNLQRYETPGDYFRDGHDIKIRVSELNDKRYEFLVALHELIEYFMIELKGIKIEDIDSFDKNFELERSQGLHSAEEEPGDSKKAPYYHAHQIATGIERIMAPLIGVDWNEYNEAVVNLSKNA